MNARRALCNFTQQQRFLTRSSRKSLSQTKPGQLRTRNLFDSGILFSCTQGLLLYYKLVWQKKKSHHQMWLQWMLWVSQGPDKWSTKEMHRLNVLTAYYLYSVAVCKQANKQKRAASVIFTAEICTLRNKMCPLWLQNGGYLQLPCVQPRGNTAKALMTAVCANKTGHQSSQRLIRTVSAALWTWAHVVPFCQFFLVTNLHKSRKITGQIKSFNVFKSGFLHLM